MRTNTAKAKMAEGKVVFGAIISRHAPDLVELFGAIGYDFVMIDCEHGPMSLDEVEHMVRAAEVFGITPITRIPNHEDSTILRFLDRGVTAALSEDSRPCPPKRLDTRQEAAIVAMVCGPPPAGCARWTMRLTTEETKRRGIEADVGRERRPKRE